jgi:hypothetical protein
LKAVIIPAQQKERIFLAVFLEPKAHHVYSRGDAGTFAESGSGYGSDRSGSCCITDLRNSIA